MSRTCRGHVQDMSRRLAGDCVPCGRATRRLKRAPLPSAERRALLWGTCHGRVWDMSRTCPAVAKGLGDAGVEPRAPQRARVVPRRFLEGS